MAPSSRQVNVTLDPQDFEILEAVAFVESSTKPEVVRPALVSYLRSKGKEPPVRAAMRARAKNARD